ncbi:hypothetical protein CEXT_680941 [Caerostris extrusa]|uniref:Ycf15 n=1 Tax=Caerostris extrusa TaxID=172846 RepID=A0AAV4X4F8_CAEEX|nr:hypothetical protein CEXT_680941 [Caerostris extrusa]
MHRVTKRNGRVSSNLSLKTLMAIFFRFLVIDSGTRRATEEEETSGVSVIPPMNQKLYLHSYPGYRVMRNLSVQSSSLSVPRQDLRFIN